MIETITKAQEKKMPAYLNKWLKIGLRTKAIDRKKAKKSVHFIYEKILKMDKPKYLIFLDSPMACQLACNLLKDTKFDEKISGSQLYSQLRSQLDSQLRSQLYSQLRSQLDSQLRSQLDSQLDSQKLEYFYVGWSNLFMSWYGHYDFILNEIFPKERKKFSLFQEFLKTTEDYHQVYIFKDIAFVSDFPKQISRNEENQLHSYDKAALLYRDGYSLFRSNGIEIHQKYIDTPADKITKDMYLAEENADMRREIVRKIGLERFTKLLDATIIDTLKTKNGGTYELLHVDFDGRSKRPYLRMKCASTGHTHLLGVPIETKTAEAAWAFINNEPKLSETVWEA